MERIQKFILNIVYKYLYTNIYNLYVKKQNIKIVKYNIKLN